jgi:carboxymethylenebutenolidase
MSDAMRAATVEIEGHGGDTIQAYLAGPTDREPAGGVVVIHHMPGWDEGSKEITRRFAAEGYPAICPNLYSREAPNASPEEAAALVRERGGVPDERLVGDVAGSIAHLRGLGSCNGKVATIGYCSGGRQSFLAACSLELDAAVDCYGGLVVGQVPEGFPVKEMKPIGHLAPQLSCPLLGLFGAEDQFPSPEHVDELERRLTEAGKTFEFHSFEGAGHAFFATERPSYRPEAAVEGWGYVWDFFGRHLSKG